ncbi:hypothetical protein UO65_0598 [Actinokineospora spheciospongiae]|uniref:Uncharacterized protein n=1 Tax=Actinokineospora spheciospongiae TaxID=909613 RepID=W7J524_9PSEU|nr:hypothetical protein [Actinokineospora spheciospongiae]EWC64071.1 hypothetical protein UO65_0598 [Actinokineospora spheciospongiae]
MALPSRRTLRTAAVALAAATALGGLAATTAQADTVGALSGSGTISDPWNPTHAAHITCNSATLFANYSPSAGHRDPIATLSQGNYIGVRYITSNNYSADVFWHGTSQWGFLLRSCFSLN